MNPLPFTRPAIGEEEKAGVMEVLDSGWITSGPKVRELEENLQSYVGGGVTVRLFNSATSALEAVLIASDIGPGDEVIVPAMSFVASANVVMRAGARPVFVDVDLVTRNMDTAAAAAAVTNNTRALMPVHFAGLSADMEPLRELAADRLLLLEDAAQAIGTGYRGQKTGSDGNPVVFSFHPNKNMTTIEGGAVACRDRQLVRRLEVIRFHGLSGGAGPAAEVEEWGGKMNLPDVCAAVGLAQLRKLDSFNQRRRQLARRYLANLPAHSALVVPEDSPGHSWHMFCVCLDFEAIGRPREAVVEHFRQYGISLGYHYPAIHLFGLYRRLGYEPGDFPNAERIGRETLTLPLFPLMSDADVDRVCECFDALLAQN